MIDWDALPFQSQPTQPNVGQLWEYHAPEGRVGKLYWIAVKLKTNVGGAPVGRRLHMELGGIVFMPGTSDNLFGSIGGGGHNGHTGYFFIAPKQPQYVATEAEFQSAPMMEPNEIFWDNSYWLKTYVFSMQSIDQLTIAWGYKEQDLV